MAATEECDSAEFFFSFFSRVDYDFLNIFGKKIRIKWSSHPVEPREQNLGNRLIDIWDSPDMRFLGLSLFLLIVMIEWVSGIQGTRRKKPCVQTSVGSICGQG